MSSGGAHVDVRCCARCGAAGRIELHGPLSVFSATAAVFAVPVPSAVVDGYRDRLTGAGAAYDAQVGYG